MDEYGNCRVLVPDLYIKDHAVDNGNFEPNTILFSLFFNRRTPFESPDIWVEDMAGNKIGNVWSNQDYKICVRIRNRGTLASTGDEKLYLNWNRNNFEDSWRNGWQNSYAYCPNGSSVLAGDVVAGTGTGVAVGEVIQPGGAYIKKIDWHSPSELDFMFCNGFLQKWQKIIDRPINSNYGFLARIHDGKAIPNEPAAQSVSLKTFVCASNNVAVNKKAVLAGKFGRIIFLRPDILPFDIAINFNANASDQKLPKYAELYIQLDEDLLNQWKANGAEGEGFKITDKGFLITSPDGAVIKNLQVTDKNAINGYGIFVEFLSKETPESSDFDFVVSQLVNDSTVIDEVPFAAVRNMDRYFAVQAHAEAILRDKSLILRADELGEPAKYIWYNANGKEIGSEREIEFELPKFSQWFKLEVIADADNYKDYDSVFVFVPAGFIVSLAPNPTHNDVTVEYFLSDEVHTSSLMVYNSFGNLLINEPITNAETEKTFYLGGLLPGTYSVILVANSIPSDSKTLIKQ
jgi:hypothetical protein